jgi:hypothetical protein
MGCTGNPTPATTPPVPDAEAAAAEYNRLAADLDRLIAAGQGDSPEAETIRDQMDCPWRRAGGNAGVAPVPMSQSHRNPPADCDGPVPDAAASALRTTIETADLHPGLVPDTTPSPAWLTFGQMRELDRYIRRLLADRDRDRAELERLREQVERLNRDLNAALSHQGYSREEG